MAGVKSVQDRRLTETLLLMTSTSMRSPGAALARSRSFSSANPKTFPVSCSSSSMSAVNGNDLPREGLTVVVENADRGLLGRLEAGELVTCS